MDKEERLAKEQVKTEQEVNKKLLNKRELEYYILKQQNQSENNQSALEVAIDVFCENKKVKVFQISKNEYELEY